MTRHHVLCAAGLALALGMPARAEESFVPGQVIVQLEDGFSIDAINADYGTSTLGNIPGEDDYLLVLPDGTDEMAILSELELDPRVEGADLNELLESSEGSSQSFFFNTVSQIEFSGQYAWDTISLADAQLAVTGVGVSIAILDTGITPDHPLFSTVDVVYRPENNFVEPGTDPHDSTEGNLAGHGTFMAGLIAGVAPSATLIPIRLLDDNGASTAFSIALAIHRAVDVEQADVINLSFGGQSDNDLVASALAHARLNGVAVVAAAGNGNQLDPSYSPATDPTVLAVASTDADDVKSEFSNYGEYVDLCAPGSSIVSALGSDYGSGDGSSMSAAIVSGSVALLRAANPGATLSQIEQMLLANADNIDAQNPDHIGLLGAGRLNVAAALGVAGLPAGDTNADGAVDVSDLIAVITNWGPCPPVPAVCAADINSDGQVNTLDLLQVILSWT